MAVNVPELIGEAFSPIRAIERVYICASGPALRIFTVIDREDEDVYDIIYQRERLLRRALAAVPAVRFNVIARRGRPIEDIVGDLSPVWERPLEAQSCHNATNI